MKISTKGDGVVPKQMRDRWQYNPGTIPIKYKEAAKAYWKETLTLPTKDYKKKAENRFKGITVKLL